MRTLLLSVIMLAGQACAAGPLNDRLLLEFRADYAAAFEGYAKVRQDTIPGDHLDLSNDLGVRQWFGFTFEAAFRFDQKHAVRAGFHWHQFRGGATYDHLVRYNGAYYGAGTTIDFGPTQWWRLELWYEFTAWHEQAATLTLLAGLVMDDLTVFTRPNRELLGAKQEHKEDFGEHRLPLPAIGARVEIRPLDRLRLAVEARGMHVDNLPTPYVEGSRIHKTTTYFDMWAEIGYRVAELEFGIAARYRAFHLNDEGELGGDEFSVRGVIVGAFIRVWL
jgi:hypothetical protein